MIDGQPLVSIIVRTAGERPALLAQALKSIAAQRYPAIEAIVVEDGGERMAALVQPLAAEGGAAFRYLPITKSGRSRAGNVGLGAARGQLLGFLDDDDGLLPRHVDTLVGALQAAPSAVAAYGVACPIAMSAKSDFADESALAGAEGSAGFSRPLLWLHNFLPIQSVLFHRRLFEGFGGFDEALDSLEDWDLWLRYSAAGRFLPVNAVTSYYRLPDQPAARRRRADAHRRMLPAIRARHPTLPNGIDIDEVEALLAAIQAGPEAYIPATSLARGLWRKLRMHARALFGELP